uniref:Serine hydrolase domain-containing protein n=1 Tax=Daucus carota subsp. sativus TaxID=79200 RepID=A0A161ZXV7_DAUCS
MGDTSVENNRNKEKKILCLHGFRTSGSFLKNQLSKWDLPTASVFSDFHLVYFFTLFKWEFLDGFFPAGGKSEIEGYFPPPYFEWFQHENDFTVYFNLEECITRLCDYITSNGPFYGAKFKTPSICEIAYKEPIKVKSVHCIGAKDWLKVPSEKLASAFEDPLIINHPYGHTVPRLDEEAVKKIRDWIADVSEADSHVGNGVLNENNSAIEKAEETLKECDLREEESK